MSNYPDWVLAHKKKGQTIKKIGPHYYLYNRKAKYVPGRKYPTTVDTYLGRITPEGFIPAKTRRVAKNSIKVREYGFSMFLLSVVPPVWKQIAGDDWENILKHIILSKSPNSFLRDETLDELHPSTDLVRLEASLRNQLGASLKSFEALKYVYQLQTPDGSVISEIEPEQQSVLDKYGVSL